jgi:iron complex transport system substrate-binding protein
MNLQSYIVRRACPLGALAVTILLAMLAEIAQAAPVTVKDAQGREVKIENSSRIISIGGAVTEILYAMGLEDRIVGIDTTSIYPPRALKEKPNVGYMRQLSPEGVLGLGPTLVLAAGGAGPKEAVEVLELAAVPLVNVPDHFTSEGILERIRMIAAATGVPERGECLGKDVQTRLADLAALRKKIETPARVLFILSFTNGKPMVAGRGTAADGVIRLAGAVNAVTEFEGYKMISDEAIIAARPDAILGMERSDFRMTASEIFAHAALASTPAAQRRSYISMNGLYLLGFGPRTVQAATDLAHALYPALPADQSATDDNVALSCRE